MSGQKQSANTERERIAESIANIDNLWILGQIYKFIVNMTRGTKYEAFVSEKGGAANV